MRNLDPKWHWEATFTDGATITFLADSKALALDHAQTLGRDLEGGPRVVRAVRRIGHVSGMTTQDRVHLGALYQ